MNDGTSKINVLGMNLKVLKGIALMNHFEAIVMAVKLPGADYSTFTSYYAL